MNTPQMRFKDFNNKWDTKYLKTILKVNSGRDYKHLKTGDIPVYGTGGYMLSVNRSLSEEDAIGIGRKGSIDKPQKLKAPFWTVDTLFYCTSKNETDLDFLFVLFNKINWKKYDESTGVPSLSKNTIENISVYVPSINEQQRMGEFFNTLDSKIHLQQEKVELLKAKKKGLMQKVFSQELRFKDEDGQKYPNWKVVSLGAVANINPKSVPLNNSFQYIDLESVIGGQLKSAKFIDKHNAPSRAQRVIKKGDILYQTVRPYQKNNLYFNKDINGQVVASTGYAQIRVNKSILETYLYQYLNTERFTYHVLKSCTGTSYPAINSSDLSVIEIHLPHLDEQTKIASLLTILDDKIKWESKKYQQLDIQKRAYMQQMFI